MVSYLLGDRVMIRIYVSGFSTSDSGGPRWGDCTVIDDGENYEVVDGYCGVGATRMLKRLKDRDIRDPYLYISHPHYDHYKLIRDIIRDNWFKPRALYCYDPESLRTSNVRNSGGYDYIKTEISNLHKIINEATEKGIRVIFLKHGNHIKHGDIDFYVYRKQPTVLEWDDNHGDSYMNDGSLCFWFPALRYWTSGDGPEKIYDMCKSVGAKPVFFKIPHHGNNCPQSQANGMKSLGAKYCWDNDISTKITDFLMFGRRRCIEAGIKYFSCIGDLNAVAEAGVFSIYKDGGAYRYNCPYNRKKLLRDHSAAVVRQVMQDKYSNGNTRITKLIDAGWDPAKVQDKVNKVVATAKGIKDGSLNYGKNAARIKKIDLLLGAGYGQLTQDYINVLYGVRKGV